MLAATEPALPALLKPTLDDGFVRKDLDTVALMAVMLVLVFFIRGVAAYASAVSMAWVAGKVVMDLRNRMFEKLLLLPSSYYDANPSGQLISKLTFNANQVTEAASSVLTILVRDTLAIVGPIGLDALSRLAVDPHRVRGRTGCCSHRASFQCTSTQDEPQPPAEHGRCSRKP